VLELRVVLPDALALVSGNLSWTGSVPPDGEVKAIDAIVQSVKIGNWKVAITVPFLPYNDKENLGHYDFYISISEKSAEWRVYPPYDSHPQTTATQAVPQKNSKLIIPPTDSMSTSNN